MTPTIVGRFTKVILGDITYSRVFSFSIFVPNSNFNVDLSDHGNANPGTPVTLWEKWEGENQVWRFEQA